MVERLLFLTGHLAEARLVKELARMGETPFSWQVRDVGVKVAALMTEAILARRLPQPLDADRVILPGRVRADLERLSARFGARFERGPDEIADLSAYLGRGGKPPDLSHHDTRIFAEIVDAPHMDIAAILERANMMRGAGADVIDLGCLPDTPFPHLEDAVRALKADGIAVSIDSADTDELKRGMGAGCDAVFSLTEETLELAADSGVEAVLVPKPHGDLGSLLSSIEEAERRGMRYMADPILDPIHFGFAASLGRYGELRQAMPQAPMLMGTGNLTELTDADSGGMTALLMGLCSELAIRNVLVVHVSPHTRRTIEEHDAARRMMFAAREDGSLPRNYSADLLQLHGRKPFASSADEIAAMAADVRDANFRIEVAEDGIHVYSAKGHHVAQDAMSLFDRLGVATDGAHAFYLGSELMKAEIALKLGKRYAQDEPLDWGVGTLRGAGDLSRLAEAGHTLRAKRRETD